jgi:hypothetical protein
MKAMPEFHRAPTPQATRRALMLGLPALLLGCGGGGGGAEPPPPPLEGSLDARILRASRIGVDYGLQVYLPPLAAGPRENLPIVYALDGETWFDTLVRSVESSRTRAVLVGINSVSRRNLDFVPPNSCTAGGGGQAPYLDFLRTEVLPYIEGLFGGDPRQRMLFGHSHGGSFVLYALLAEAPGTHAFRGYMACDASLGCLFDTAMLWQERYAAAHRALPVRLHLSHASSGNVLSNVPYADALAARRFEGFGLQPQAYSGSHSGIVPQAIADGLAYVRGGG